MIKYSIFDRYSNYSMFTYRPISLTRNPLLTRDNSQVGLKSNIPLALHFPQRSLL